MFDEIFKRWITTNQLTKDDIIPLFLEWNQVFGDGKATPQEVMTLLTFIYVDYFKVMTYILKMVGIKKGYEWEEVRDKNGIVINRFFINGSKLS